MKLSANSGDFSRTRRLREGRSDCGATANEMVGMENFALSASGPPDRRSAPELHPVEIGVSDGSCIRISETHNLGHYWLCYTHHESGRAPRPRLSVSWSQARRITIFLAPEK